MKKIKGSVRYITVNPSNAQMCIEGVSPEDAHVQYWKWVDCKELGQCVRDIFAEQGVVWPAPEDICATHESLIPRHLFSRYGFLEVDGDGNPIHTWANDTSVMIKGPPPSDHEWGGILKIPYRVSLGILSLARVGIVGVKVERIPLSGSTNLYWHIGVDMQGGLWEILDSGHCDGSRRIEEWRPPVKAETTS